MSTGVVKMSGTFCSSQQNRYVPCGNLFVDNDSRSPGCLREISHFLSGKRQNHKDLHPLEQKPYVWRHRKDAHVFLLPV